MAEACHLLIVDDEPGIRLMLRRYLSNEGFEIDEASDGASVRELLEREVYDLILLDIRMPGEDGLSLTRHIRQHFKVPIIIVSGRDDAIDRVAGLETGADDYIGKPFNLREVLARIRTVLRRNHAEPTRPLRSAAPSTAGNVLRFQGWRLYVDRRELSRADGRAVPLSLGEFNLLHAFVTHPNRALNRDQLMDLVMGRDWAAFDRAVDSLVMRLRRKIEDDPAEPALIKTIRGAGYMWVSAVASD